VERVRIISAAVAHPPIRIDQTEAAERIAGLTGDERRVRAIARGSQIESRAAVMPADEIRRLGSIEVRNAVYEAWAPRLAVQAASRLGACLEDVGMLVTTSCTGYMVPGLDVHVAQALGLRPDTARLPVTEAGCAGGIVALARAADRLRAQPASALVVAAELCSLAFHPDAEEGNLTSALLFGDGAGAVLLESGGQDATDALEVVDGASLLVPCSRDFIGFRLTDSGFYPLLARSLTERLPDPTAEAVASLLRRNGLCEADVDYWLIHPGGPRIVEALQRLLAIPDAKVCWSWETLRGSGNTSSAAIIEVLSRYLGDPKAPRGWGVMVAFGPGVSIELLLVRRC
jgi:alkylresorcinol/alkylpyrone synthase